MTEKKDAPKKRTPRKRVTKSKGLGDTIEKVTTATGIKAVVKAVAGDDCGCEERKQKLNDLFPYMDKQTKMHMVMSEDQKLVWTEVLVPARRSGRLNGPAQAALVKLFQDLGVQRNFNFKGCGGCATKALNEMQAIYDASCETD